VASQSTIASRGREREGIPSKGNNGADQRPSTEAEGDGGEGERIDPLTACELAPKEAEERKCDQTDGDQAQPQGSSESDSPPEEKKGARHADEDSG
jgi:hypothetical protein